MFAHVSNLRYWKSERADITTCEDASRADTQRGLFCVADGAGTTLFSHIWADILVEQFVRDPLAGCDLFEMDWWIRQAQKRYRELAPPADNLHWNARQKALEQGAYATLVTVRFTHADEHTASAELLAVGDSCALIAHAGQETITSFPLQQPADFDRAPYCVPSLLKNLSRKTLYPRQTEVTLASGDCLILATDAVARWIINGGASGQPERARLAFHEVASKQTDEEWRAFIDDCRANQSMVDDDATALIVRLQADGPQEAQLGSGAQPQAETGAQRKSAFEQARAEDNKELIAILYGDGKMLQNAGLTLSKEEQEHARKVADAMRELLQAMREAVKAASFAAKIEPVWWQYADLLANEPCAETIRKTLNSQGVRLKPAVPLQALPQPHIPQQQASPLPRSQQANRPPQPQQANPLPQLPQASEQSQPEGERAAALPEQLRVAMAEGTPQQKVRAAQALFADQARLSDSDQSQLAMARPLVEALQANDDYLIAQAYDKIEFSGLRKHFIFAQEDQQRIQEARKAIEALEHWRAILRNDAKNVSLLVSTYQNLRIPEHLLSKEEAQILSAAQAFASSTRDREQTIRVGGNSRVHLYDELFFSPYCFTFSPGEQEQIEEERQLLHIARPPLALVNGRPIESTWFLLLYTVKPLHMRMQISLLQQNQGRKRPDASPYYLQEQINGWRQQITPFALPQSILNDLIHMSLIDEYLDGMPERDRRSLENQAQKIQEEFFKDIQGQLSREEAKALIAFSKEQWREALHPYAQYEVLRQHLQTWQGLTPENWLRERLRASSVSYYQRPAVSAPQTPYAQECWLFKWWFLRPVYAAPGGESQYA
jgi:hypothetical protein